MQAETHLGDYTVICQLGQGLWSRDVLAEHRFIKKRFILKILLDELVASEKFMSVFHEVIVKLATVNHPSLLSVENVSQHDGKYFVVTQERDSANLSLYQYMQERKQLSESEVLHLVGQLADVLDYTHNIGLVHGSLNLHTVFVDFSDGSPCIFLPEIGFSALLQQKLIDGLEPESQQHRWQEIILSKSPEGGIGVLEDTFAFGTLVYFLLFGYLPQGIFPMPAQVYPDYVYDWDKLLTSCLRYHADQRIKHLTGALRKKSVGEQLMQARSQCEEPLRRIIPEDEVSQLPHTLIRSAECGGEPSFVLVPARSIDEAMNTSIDSSEEESEGYSPALQSLLTREPVVSRYVEEVKESWEPQPLLTEMVFVEGGSFLRGSKDCQRDEYPVHAVTLQGFFIDIHPVTNEQFLRYLEFIGSEQDAHCNELIRLKDSRIQRRSGKLTIEPGYAKHPVVGVTWYGASAYASWIDKRLPTEAEWEIAACAGNARLLYPCGEAIEKSQANFFSSDTTVVMSYSANPLGLYDMAGNVYEWCHDWYGYDFYETSALEPESPKGPSQGVYRVLRGGCWKSLKEDLRCAHRHRNNPGAVNRTYGFRCAKSWSSG